MSRFSDASKVEDAVWSLRWADLPRASNRAKIDSLFDGNPPFTEAERVEAGLKTNVNFLEPTKIAHDARRQYSNAFLTPGNYFTVTVDHGPVHKRKEWSNVITTEINRQMKLNLRYRECLRNVFAQLIMHGVGPVVWDTKEKWVPSMIMMGDLLIPSRTLLTMENLNQFAIKRRYTAEELWKLTHGPKVDKAWNMSAVNQCITWAKEQMPVNARTATVDNPEMLEQDFKENSGYYSSDIAPTIDCWDFYFYDETGKDLGWKRRIILDTNADTLTPEIKNTNGERGQFLYDSGNRNYARKLSEIIHFQFADGSAVAPFRYHTVRSLGFLLYSVCHLQNRFRCKVTDAGFEHLMQYYRANNPEDAERTLKFSFLDKGIIPNDITMVPRSDRWSVDMSVIGTMIQLNRQTMEDNSGSYTQDYDFAKDQVEKTATQITAEVTASSALVTSMLQEAYGYQEFQYREISRRFCIPNSKDMDVRTFRMACIKQGVPLEALNVDRWNVSAERIIGGGNKQMELAQNNMLMSQFPRFGPDAQNTILRNFTFAATGDAALTKELVPFDQNKVSPAKHDAQLAMGTLMLGLPVDVRPSMNHIDYVETLLLGMALIVQQIEQSGGMATKEQIIGLQNTAQHVDAHIQIIADDPEEKQRVKGYQDALGQIMNMVKAYMQRLHEQMQQQGQQGDPELNAKVQSMLIQAQSKAKINEANNAQKLEQKQISFDQKTQQAEEKHQLENANTIRKTQVDEASKDLSTVGEIQRQNAKAEAEPKESSPKQSSPKKGGKKTFKIKRGKDGAISEVVAEEN